MAEDFNFIFSYYYDSMYRNKLSKFKNQIDIYCIFAQKLNKSIHTILDVGCGTGINAIFLAEKGMRVIAIDPSIYMLSNLKKKMKIQHDIRIIAAMGQNYFSNQKVSGAVALWAVIGYMNKEDLKKFFKNVYNMLESSSIFYFNFWNKQNVYQHGFEATTSHSFIGPNGIEVTRTSRSIKLAESIQIIFEFKEGYVDLGYSIHNMNFYDLFEIYDLLKECGFKKIYVNYNTNLFFDLEERQSNLSKHISNIRELNLYALN